MWKLKSALGQSRDHLHSKLLTQNMLASWWWQCHAAVMLIKINGMMEEGLLSISLRDISSVYEFRVIRVTQCGYKSIYNTVTLFWYALHF